MPADRRRLQAARRDQSAAAADRGGAGSAASSPSRRAIMRRAWPSPRERLGIPATIVMPADAPGAEGRRDARAGRRDHLLRPPHRKPRGDRRPDRGREGRDRRAELRRRPTSSPGRAPSGSRSSSSLRQRRRRRSLVTVRRRRAGVGHRAGLPGCRDHRRRAGRLGRHAPIARAGRDRAGRAAMRRRRCATRCRRRGSRRSPSASCKARRRTRLAVSEEEVGAAVRWAWDEHRLVVEPGGAASLAALLAGKADVVPETVVDAVGREYRSGAARAAGRLGGGDAIFARLDMGRLNALDGPGQFLELGGERLQLRGQRLGVEFGEVRPRRRARCRASSRCTAGSSPRSARTPRRGVPVAAGHRRMDAKHGAGTVKKP